MNKDRNERKNQTPNAAVFVAILVVCAGGGFALGRILTPSSKSLGQAEASPIDRGLQSHAPATATTTAAGALIAEWEEFRGQQDATPESFAALYTAVTDIKDAFRRRAFRAALYAEWAAKDPTGAIAFFGQEHPGSAGQILREWIRLDPDRAITHMLAGDQRSVSMLVDAMKEIARLSPDRLVEVANRAGSIRDGSINEDASDAFAIFARTNPEAARSAAESITGSMRRSALAGVARAWAEKDPTSAMAWAQGMAKGDSRDAALSAVLIAWAKSDPFAALNQVDLLPPGRPGQDSDLGAQVLSEAARKDWDGTLKWLSDNPGKLGESSLQGLVATISQRVNDDPIATLQSLQRTSLSNAAYLVANGLSGVSREKLDSVWEWLGNQPTNSFATSVRGALLNSIAYRDPKAALERMEELPDSPDNREVFLQCAQAMFQGSTTMTRVDELLAKSSSKTRPFLLEISFAYALQRNIGADPQRWLGRIDELPQEQRSNAAGGLARSWASTDPQSATQWAFTLKDPEQRNHAIGNAVGAWSANHGREAAEWINSLPAGADRDTATVSLIGAIGRSEPETAWSWALSVQAPVQRQHALRQAFTMLQQKDPALAQQMVQGANLPGSEATALLQQVPQ
jgi:hypothetical protein